ncbi:MAG TPA: hypothetical protein VMW08_01065 [Acidimicrobiales bacterium]|nr:hypothetical protein [Acidimicrobiales bacterium]
MGCGRIAIDLSTDASDCILLSGNGSPATPLTATPILRPTFDQPLPTPAVMANGIECTPTGLVAPPDRPIGGGFGVQGVGSWPIISVDMAGAGPGGSAAWGPPLDVSIINVDPNHNVLGLGFLLIPSFHFILEPGATCSVWWEARREAINVPGPAVTPYFAGLAWHLENNGAGVIRYDVPAFNEPPTNNGGGFPAGSAVFDFIAIGFQGYIETTGFTGASSVSAGIFGSGFQYVDLGLPV